MKGFAKIILSVIIDLIVVIVLTITFNVVAEIASGLIFHKICFIDEESPAKFLQVFMKTGLVFLSVYIAVALVFKNSIGWLAAKKGKFAKALKLMFANIIDFTVILLITLLLDHALHRLFYYDIFVLLFVIFAAYYFTAIFFTGVTFGKWCFGIKFNTGNRTAILKYTVAKTACVIIFPVILFRTLGVVDPFALFMNIVLCFVIFHVFSFMVSKTTIWANFAKIGYVWQNQLLKFAFVKLVCLFLLIFIGFSSIRYINNKTNTGENGHFFGFNYPYEFKKYPNDKDVKPYTDFLKTQNQSPKEYILGLFEQYDIVVLNEAYHGESTQWEMIFDMVSDTAFIKNVGNIFTEYGSARHQHKIDTFLNTVFPNDTILEQETACLMYYMSNAYYYFIKNLNLLNSGLPDSLKVRLHFCDVKDNDDIVTYIITKQEADWTTRDSLMAQVTVDWYNGQVATGKRHKSLVVTNYRHAFGYAGGVDYVKSHTNTFGLTRGNQGQYIWEQFPDKTAAVMQSQVALHRMVPRPIHKGKWNLAIETNQNKPFGFDLKNTPFGNDHFDLYPLRGAKTKLKYEDIFTGMIFNKPHSELKEVRHPYRRYAILQAIQAKNIDLEDPQNRLYVCFSQWFDDEAHSMKWSSYLWFDLLSLYFPLIIYMLLSLMSLLSMLFYFISRTIRHNKKRGEGV
jgi:hypothetical protein